MNKKRIFQRQTAVCHTFSKPIKPIHDNTLPTEGDLHVIYVYRCDKHCDAALSPNNKLPLSKASKLNQLNKCKASLPSQPNDLLFIMDMFMCQYLRLCRCNECVFVLFVSRFDRLTQALRLYPHRTITSLQRNGN